MALITLDSSIAMNPFSPKAFIERYLRRVLNVAPPEVARKPGMLRSAVDSHAASHEEMAPAIYGTASNLADMMGEMGYMSPDDARRLSMCFRADAEDAPFRSAYLG
jgi:hypothetical protein